MSCGASKKQVALQDDDTIDDLRTNISAKLKINSLDSLQVFNKEFDDWLDLEEDDDLPATLSRIKVINNTNQDTGKAADKEDNSKE